MAKTQPRASVYLSDSLNEKVELECERTKLSKNRLILKIIEDYFDNLESESNVTPQPMTEDEKEMLIGHERGMVEMKNDIGNLKNQCDNIESEISELKRLILSGR